MLIGFPFLCLFRRLISTPYWVWPIHWCSLLWSLKVWLPGAVPALTLGLTVLFVCVCVCVCVCVSDQAQCRLHTTQLLRVFGLCERHVHRQSTTLAPFTSLTNRPFTYTQQSHSVLLLCVLCCVVLCCGSRRTWMMRSCLSPPATPGLYARYHRMRPPPPASVVAYQFLRQ